MRTIPAPELDAWLRAGRTVVAASDRAARAVRAAYHRARRAEGLTAWNSPDVLDWSGFARQQWERRVSQSRLILNAPQELSLWLQVIVESGLTSGWLETPLRRLAKLAIDAHGLLCAYAPNLLRSATRRHWQQDAAAFSAWLSAFAELCGQRNFVSPSVLPLELAEMVEQESSARPPLVLAGFDRLLPIQQRLFDFWGECRLVEPGEPARDVRFYTAPSEEAEIAACAEWCRQQLDADPQARLLIICQDAQQRRGQIERGLLRSRSYRKGEFDFTLGIQLGQTALARASHLLLRWMDGALDEHELDWLLSSGHSALSPDETSALQAYMRTLRRRGLQRTRWTLDAFLSQPAGSAAPTVKWIERMRTARQFLRKKSGVSQSPLEWSALASQLLETIGWPGGRPLTSAEFQVASRWQQALDLCGSLGFDGLTVRWDWFVSELERIAQEMLFSEETQDPSILIAGAAESAGLNADGIWFLGTDEETWPAPGNTHPLLPIEVQREAAMPHAWPALDWQLGEAITTRVLQSAPQVCMSYAQLKEDVDTRPSRMMALFAGSPQPLPAELRPDVSHVPLTAAYEDTLAIPLPSVRSRTSTPQLSLFDDVGTQPEILQSYEVPGGSTVLTAQSQCAFKAFAMARLGAQDWEPAEAGLTAAHRGQLLHAALHSIWSDTPQGIRSWAQLNNLGAELRFFVESHVHRIFEEQLPVGVRDHMPARYLELEEQRLVKLLTEWLEFERTREPFDVASTEIAESPAVAGLTLKLRLDRVDRLGDGSLLVMDYKTGAVTPAAWELPRPDDVQLPLYAGFGVPSREQVGGLVFAKIRPGEMEFAGKVANAKATLDSSLKGTSGLIKDPLTPARLAEWRQAIEQLARNFISGRADVNPRDYPKTCERCGLYTLCRVLERDDHSEDELEEEESGPEVADE